MVETFPGRARKRWASEATGGADDKLTVSWFTRIFGEHVRKYVQARDDAVPASSE